MKSIWWYIRFFLSQSPILILIYILCFYFFNWFLFSRCILEFRTFYYKWILFEVTATPAPWGVTVAYTWFVPYSVTIPIFALHFCFFLPCWIPPDVITYSNWVEHTTIVSKYPHQTDFQELILFLYLRYYRWCFNSKLVLILN